MDSLVNRAVRKTRDGEPYFNLLRRAEPKLSRHWIFFDGKDLKVRSTTLSQVPPYWPDLAKYNADLIMRFLMWYGRHAWEARRSGTGVVSLAEAIDYFLKNRKYVPTDCTKQGNNRRHHVNCS